MVIPTIPTISDPTGYFIFTSFNGKMKLILVTMQTSENSTATNKSECDKFPYRRIVGQLMYGMVHSMICIICYAFGEARGVVE